MQASPTTPGSYGLRPVTAEGPLVKLPPDTLLMILQYLPDTTSLRNAVLAHDLFYAAFQNYQSSTILAVLKIELPEGTLNHALVYHEVCKNRLTLPEFQYLDIDHISLFVRGIRAYRDNVSNIKVSPKGALSISCAAKQMHQLCHTCVEDNSYSVDQNFQPVWDSIRYRPPENSEILRIEKALYLFFMLAYICRNLFFRGRDMECLADCQDKVIELQRCIVEHLMAPWELHQVIGIQAYFRRALHGFGKPPHESERLMPRILSLGLDKIYECICVAGWMNLDPIVVEWDSEALNNPPHALGLVLSRGFNNRWTRKKPKRHGSYNPFDDDDYLARRGYESWTILEAMQLKFFIGEAAGDTFRQELEILEGQLDLWSSALWNRDRWTDIICSIRLWYDPEAGDWHGINFHWDYFTVGLQVMADTITSGRSMVTSE